jgi:hypothetical protein
MDIDKIASMLCEDVTINNGVMFDDDLFDGDDLLFEARKGYYSLMRDKFDQSYKEALKDSGATDEGPTPEQQEIAIGKLEDHLGRLRESAFLKRQTPKRRELAVAAYEDVIAGAKSKLKQAQTTATRADTAQAAQPAETPGKKPTNFGEVLAGMKQGDAKDIRVAGRKVNVELMEPPQPEAAAQPEAATPAAAQPEAASPAAPAPATPEAPTDEEQARARAAAVEGNPIAARAAAKGDAARRESVNLTQAQNDLGVTREQMSRWVTKGWVSREPGAGGMPYYNVDEIKAAAAKEAATKPAAQAVKPAPTKKALAGAGMAGVAPTSDDINYHNISAISEGICDINMTNGMIDEAAAVARPSIDNRSVARALKMVNAGQNKFSLGEFSKDLMSIWGELPEEIKGSLAVAGKDVSPEESGRIAKEIETRILSKMSKEDPARYDQKITGLKKGQGAMKQAGDKLTQMISKARVGQPFKVKLPKTAGPGGGAVAKLTVRESVTEEYVEEVDGDILLHSVGDFHSF